MQLVDSVMRGTPPQPSQATDPERTGMEVVVPAVGLIATGILALLTNTVLGAVVVYNSPSYEEVKPWCILGGLASVAGAGVLIVGGVCMLRLRYYAWAVAAAFAAMLPWSYAWFLGLPMGIWALRVLRRPEVIEATLENSHASGRSAPGPQEQKKGLPGKVLSFFRSMGGYFLTTKHYAAPDASTGPTTTPPVAGASE
jgi:hypothetical protein